MLKTNIQDMLYQTQFNTRGKVTLYRLITAKSYPLPLDNRGKVTL